jgi:hypothetical protein
MCSLAHIPVKSFDWNTNYAADNEDRYDNGPRQHRSMNNDGISSNRGERFAQIQVHRELVSVYPCPHKHRFTL